MIYQNIKKWFYVYGLLVVPVLLVLTASLLKQARGPYWMGSNYDPDYAYLLNSLNLAQGHGIGHYDHPGTPAQIIGAIVIRLTYFIKTFNFAGLEENVIAQPEFYLQTISWVLVTTNALLVFLIGLTSWRLTGNFWQSILLQSAPFFSTIVLNNSLTKVSAEPLLLTATLFFIWLSLFLIKSKDSPNKHRFGVGYGLIAGLGLATKINFLPLTVAPLFILAGLKTKVIYIMATVLAFIFFTLPIVPIYPAFFSWTYRIYRHAGIHGTGEVSIFNASQFLANLNRLADDFQTILIILAMVVAFIIYLASSPASRPLLRTRDSRLVIGILAAQLVGVMIVGKHPGNHYLIPAIILIGLLVFTTLRLINQTNHQLTLWPLVIKLSLVILVVQLYSQTLTTLQGLTKDLTTETKNLSRIYDKTLAEFNDYAKIYYFRASAPASALKFGDDLALGLHAPVLKKIYPDVFYYNIWEKQLYSWNDPIKISDILTKFDQKIVLIGTSFTKHYQSEPQYKPNLSLVDILDGDPETIYQLAD